MKLSLLVAMAENRVIGRDGELPWHLPADLRHFKKLTLDRAILMGRRTWESIGRPLPKRRSVVLSRRPGYEAVGAEVVPGLDEALELVAQDDEVFVIGGAELFADALARAERLYLTRVHAEVEGDVLMPPFAADSWKLIREEAHDADEHHAFAFTFQLYERSL
jgi:dihydrofolate reductase